MIDPATIVARYEAEEARHGDFCERYDEAIIHAAIASTAEALGVSRQEVAEALGQKWSGLRG